MICEGYDSPDDNYILKGTPQIRAWGNSGTVADLCGTGSCGVEYRLALTDYGYEKYGYSSFSRMTSGKNGLSRSSYRIIAPAANTVFQLIGASPGSG